MFLPIRTFGLSVFIFLLYISVNKNILYKSNIFHPIIIILFIIFIIHLFSAFFNVIDASAISSLLRIFNLLMLILLLSNVLRSKKYMLISSAVLIFISIVIIIYYAQFFLGIYYNKELINIIESISSTLGNKNLLASIFLLSIPFVSYVYIFSRKKLKILSAIIFFIILISLIIIQSKSALLALSVLIFLISIGLIKRYPRKILFYIIGIITIVIILIMTNYKLLDQYNNEINQIAKKIERIDDGRLHVNDSRIALYSKTIKMISDHYLCGVGPGQWKNIFGSYGLTNTIGQKGKKIVQRPHSDILWSFAEGGILAGFLYLIFLFILIFYSYKLYKNSKHKLRLFYYIVFSTISAYVFILALDFSSERVSHTVFFSIICAILISANNNHEKIKTININRGIYYFILLLLLFNISFSYLRYKSERHMSKVLLYKANNEWDKMISELDKVYNSFYYDTDNTNTPISWYYGIAYFNKGDQDKSFDYFKRAYEKNKYHLHVINNLATSYGFTNDYKKSKELYRQCLSVSNSFEECALNLSAIYSYENKYEKALDILLNVHDFNIENKECLTEIYISYINQISNELLFKYLSINNDKHDKVKYNFFDNSSLLILYNQIKKVAFLRKEKKMEYLNIFQKSKIFEEHAINLSNFYFNEKNYDKAFDILLNVHNYNIKDSSCLSNLYINTFLKVSENLFDTYTINLENENVTTKKYIFEKNNKAHLFYQFKIISWLRKEKGMDYYNIYKRILYE